MTTIRLTVKRGKWPIGLPPDAIGCLADGLSGCITLIVFGRVAAAGDPVTPQPSILIGLADLSGEGRMAGWQPAMLWLS